MLKQYPKDVKLVHKNFPLRNHAQAKPAAIAALAAHKQGKFWQMHDKIFESYNQLDANKFKEFAKQIGLNMNTFEKDLKDPDILRQVQLDLLNGSSAGVRGTPTLFINGIRLNNRSLSGFKAIIDKELNKKRKK